MAFSEKLVHGEKLTEDNFKNPPVELGILPFWFWNGDMDEEEMEWQLKEYKDKGIPGLFIHGRFGETIGYLSEVWFKKVQFAVKKAKEIGIDIWIYDEMNWPSGTAERQVLKKYPHLSQKYLELVALNVDGPLFTFLEATDDRYVNTGDSKPIAAYACTEREYRTKIDKLIDLTPNLSFDKVIPWEAPKGKWRLLYFLEKEANYYIDTMNPESTNRFIEITHEGYKNAVGEDFGSVIPGFYTDEPAMHYYHAGKDNYVIPWTSQMFKIFREKRGYDLKPHLPALYLDMGEKTASIRYDFWRTLTEQYAETYYKRIRDWCDDNGVLFTGHVLFEEWLRLQARCEGNIFKYLEHMHITGVDHLYPKIGTRKEPDQHVALKLGSSAAHHFGSTRLLCESMGGTYWDCSLERMKWIANWEYVLGVNLFNNHGYHYSIEGERKRDWPPSQFYHHTWWKYYNHFTTYMARLGHVLSGGRHVAKILIIWPINSMWTNYVPQKHNAVSRNLEKSFNWLTDILLRHHFDFDYVDEDILAKAEIKNGKIHIRDEEYELLILPHLSHIKKDTYDALKKFISRNGKVIADTILPVELLETEKDGIASDMIHWFGYNPKDLLKQYKTADYKPKRKGDAKENLFFLNGKKISKHKKEKELIKVLNEMIVPDVIIDHEDVFYLHRIKDDHDLYFLTNVNQKNIGLVNISFEKVGKPELWDLDTGEITPLHVYQLKDYRTNITLNFGPAAAYLVVFRDKLPSVSVSESNIEITSSDNGVIKGHSIHNIPEVIIKTEGKKGSKVIKKEAMHNLPQIPLGNKFSFTIEEDNVLCISDWKMKIGDADNSVSSDHDDSSWLNVTNGAWEMQLPQERDEESYPVDLVYRTKFNIEYMPERLALLIDGFSGTKHCLFINGQEVTSERRRSRLDAEIKEVDIREYVTEGNNTVAVKLTANRRTDGILDLLKIIGSFALTEKDNSYIITKQKDHITIGDWTNKGYPYFSGTGIYETVFNLPSEYLDGSLFLDTNIGEDVLEVVVNDNTPVTIPWHPYRINITNLVKAGDNKIQFRVTNTLINILEGVKKKSGLLNQPKILHANNYEIKI
jgi:hypothetical protein